MHQVSSVCWQPLSSLIEFGIQLVTLARLVKHWLKLAQKAGAEIQTSVVVASIDHKDGEGNAL
jgi:hypothetical protein